MANPIEDFIKEQIDYVDLKFKEKLKKTDISAQDYIDLLEINKKNDKDQIYSLKDKLTKDIFNREGIVTYSKPFFNKYLNGSNKNFALSFIDIDGFKGINDSYGHNTGDLVLKYCSELFKKQNLAIGRAGGDEFLVFSQDSTKENLEKKLMQFTKNIMHQKCSAIDNIKLSFSIGVCFSDQLDKMRNFIINSDKNQIEELNQIFNNYLNFKENFYKKNKKENNKKTTRDFKRGEKSIDDNFFNDFKSNFDLQSNLELDATNLYALFNAIKEEKELNNIKNNDIAVHILRNIAYTIADSNMYKIKIGTNQFKKGGIGFSDKLVFLRDNKKHIISQYN